MSLIIGKYINYALGAGNAQELHAKIGGRVFPVAVPADMEPTVPYICYNSESMTADYTKDGELDEMCTVSVDVVARSYEELMDLLSMVRDAMELGWCEWNERTPREFSVVEQTMSAGAEEWDEYLNAYCRKMVYTIITEE